jgi:phosphomannomutase
MTRSSEISKEVLDRARQWLSNCFDEATRQQVQQWMDYDPVELEEAFWKDLEFGTGGMRGIMGIGSARMNTYTVQKATQGLCNWLKQRYPGKSLKSVIAFDSRHQSQKFALDAARVFAANKIEAWVFPELRPTPMLSFAVRHLQADCGIMITASHNPPEYNGFKVYNHEGCQFYLPDDENIVQSVNHTSYEDIQAGYLSDPLIHMLDASLDEAYLETITRERRLKRMSVELPKSLKIIYSNLHGTGITLVPQALKRWGFNEVQLVDSQSLPDGHFPTVVAPNPEDPAAMELGVQMMLAQKADLLLANDPDADRLGAAVIDEHKSRLLNGQEMAILLTDFLLRHNNPSQSPQPAIVKSLVTSNLIQKMCRRHGVACFDVLPGFKFIGRLMARWQKQQHYRFLLGAEESHGYLSGLHARDKDGVISACLLCELALECKLEEKTLVDRLEELYLEYGYSAHRLLNLSQKDTPEGRFIMDTQMKNLRQNPIQTLAGSRLIHTDDLSLDKVAEPLIPSNVLIWKLEDESEVIIRPSGTEPKIKVYISYQAPVVTKELLKTSMQEAAQRLDRIEEAVRQLFNPN